MGIKIATRPGRNKIVILERKIEDDDEDEDENEKPSLLTDVM